MSSSPDPGLVRAELELRLAWAREHGAAYDAGVWELLLGRPEEGLETIRAEAGAVARPELPVLVGAWEHAAGAARLALGEPTDSLVSGYRPYLRTLYALIADAPDVAAEQLQQLRAYVEGRSKLASGHPADVVHIAEGLAQRSSELLTSGVDTLLAWHVRRARARSEIFNSARAVVSLEAVVAVLLAHRLGLAVSVAPSYRRVSLPLLVVHLDEWEGEPLPRASRATIETDLVAGPWLRLNGLELPDPPPASASRSRPARARRLATDVEPAAVRESLRERVRARQGSAWQLASWALMIGDAGSARGYLVGEAAAAQRRWQESVPIVVSLRGGPAALPGHNYLREHFAVALVLGDEAGIRRTSELLRDWDGTPALVDVYRHASGYLDVIRHLLDPRASKPAREDAEQVLGPLPSVRVACVGLVERDEAMLARGLRGMLQEHARALERTSSPDPPICAAAVHVAAAAARLGLTVEVEDAVRVYDVPIVVHDGGRKVGRLTCDLLGTALWRTG